MHLVVCVFYIKHDENKKKIHNLRKKEKKIKERGRRRSRRRKSSVKEWRSPVCPVYITGRTKKNSISKF